MFKLLGLSLVLLIISLVLRNYNYTISVLISIAGAIVIFVFLSDKVSEILLYIRDISAAGQGSRYLAIMVRILAIVVIGQFLNNVCMDSGEKALASMVELGTKVIIVSMLLPLFDDVINIVRSLTS